MAKNEEKHTIHWFRRGLRLHDNPSLSAGLKSATTFRCVFILDPWFAGSSNVGINKWRFLLQCLEDLDSSLRNLNSRLFVIRGQPADTLPKLFREWGTTNLTFEEDPEPFGRVRDNNIMAMCSELGINVISKVSHTLYKLDKIIEDNGGRAPLTYHQFQTLITVMDPPLAAEDPITASNIGKAKTPIDDDHDEKYGVPTLEELGFDTEFLRPPVWFGGETEALARLERHLERKAWVASYGKPKMNTQSLLASDTGLSPYLRFGCLSTRLVYYKLTDLYLKIKGTSPPLSLHGQLLWREFFYCAATKNPNFDKMLGNPICVQIPWDQNADALAKWANGQTGFPWIDAIMVQLREEGWIHDLARHAVACFLTRGDLWISWEEGMKVFEELLLDADWSVNAGTWMWLSCSSFFQQFFHCYCPVRLGRKADPYGDFIRKYVPVLQNIPTQYIHAPWLAPPEVQESARCIIGRDYPMAIVDHATTARVNIQRIKQAYRKISKYKSTDSTITSNLTASSHNPNTMITGANGSNYLCNTTLKTLNTETGFQLNQTKNEQVQLSANAKFKEHYDNCNKMVSDVVKRNEDSNTSGLQTCNMPFKKIVVIGQNHDSDIKQESDIKVEIKEEINKNVVSHRSDHRSNDEFEELQANNYKFQQHNNNYYMNQRENHTSDNGYNYYNSPELNQNMKRKFIPNSPNKYKETSQTYNETVPSNYYNPCYDTWKTYYFTKNDDVKTPFNLQSNYKSDYSNSGMENVKIKDERNSCNQMSQQMKLNYDYSLQDMNPNKGNYQNQSAKLYRESETHFFSTKQDLNQCNERMQLNVEDNTGTSQCNTSENDSRTDYSLEEE